MVESNDEVHKKVAKKVSPFMINIQDSSHVKPLLERLIAANASWKTSVGNNWRLKWCSPVIQDDELISLLQQPGKIVNRYPDAKALAHKDGFAQMTNFIQALNPEVYDIAPVTFTLPSKFEGNRLIEYMGHHKGATYIVKP